MCIHKSSTHIIYQQLIRIHLHIYIDISILAQNNGFPGIPTAPNQLVTVTLMRCPAVEGQRLHERREAQQHANARVDIVPSIHMADPLGSYVIWVPFWTHRIWNYALWEMCNGELKHQNKWWWFPWWLCPINRLMTKNVSGKPMVHKQNLKWSLTLTPKHWWASKMRSSANYLKGIPDIGI